MENFIFGIYCAGFIGTFFIVGFFCVLGGKPSDLWRPIIYAIGWPIMLVKFIWDTIF